WPCARRRLPRPRNCWSTCWRPRARICCTSPRFREGPTVSEEGPGDAASGVDPLPGVLTAVTGAPWEGTFIAALAAMPSRLRVARRCVDVADLLAAASAGHGQVAFVAGDLPRFDHDTVLQLGSAGVAVVGVAAGASPEEGLLRCGVSEIVTPDDDAETLVAAITRART